MTLFHGKQLREFMRNRAELLRKKEQDGKMSSTNYSCLSMDAHCFRISGVVSRLASTGKEVLCEQLANREGVVLFLGAVEASGELQASVNNTRRRDLKVKDFALNLTRIFN